MATKIELLPRLRFPEFRGAAVWEGKRLDGLCEMNPKTESLPDEFVYIDLESVEAGNLLKKNIVRRSDAPSRAQRLLEYGDVIFQLVRPYQKNNYLFQENDCSSYVASTGYAQLRANQSSAYLYQLLHTSTFVEKVISQCEGSNYPAIASGELAKILVIVPEPYEQQKIASCLSSLDKLISAQSRKVGTLKDYKKGLMQQLFPQEGETVPRLRFPEFRDSGAWEVNEIGEIFRVTRGKVLAMDQLEESKSHEAPFPVYSSQTKNAGLAGYYREYLFEDAITWTTDGANAGDVNYRDGKFYCTNVCGVLVSVDGHANQCVAEVIDSVSKRHVSYVGNPKLMNGVMSKIRISLPLLKEQHKISALFSLLDDLISMQSHRLNALRTHKRGLMQQLFPAIDEFPR